ncbi:MAG: hypothetical protein BWZ07_03242 [Alphaproteobacteria bacterium ADurb.BinA280]|nr:MAG: hypothetical protein BWZ07_03242 [Alphaproteobacteria bacterium ADurb.BinA280]
MRQTPGDIAPSLRALRRYHFRHVVENQQAGAIGKIGSACDQGNALAARHHGVASCQIERLLPMIGRKVLRGVTQLAKFSSDGAGKLIQSMDFSKGFALIRGQRNVKNAGCAGVGGNDVHFGVEQDDPGSEVVQNGLQFLA